LAEPQNGRGIVGLDVASLTIDQVLSIAIQLEQDGIAFYKAASEKAHSKRLRDVLNILADDEVEHKLTFQGMAAEMGFGLSGGEHSSRTSRQAMESLIEAGIFPRPEERDTAIASLHSAAQALRFGIKVEKGSVAFYDSAAKASTFQDIRQTFDRIADEEREHVRLLTAELKALKASSMI